MITRQKTAVHLLIITLILFGIAWYFMSTLTFFSNDNGLRFFQIQELIKNGGSSFAVSYPLRSIDPDWMHTPLLPKLLEEKFDRFALVTEESMPISVPNQVDDIRIERVDTLIYTLDQIPELEAPHE